VKKILVADDNDVVKHLIITFLQHEFPGVEILQAQNGLEAKSKLEECPANALPDAVFTDFEMPGMNGLDLIRFIRQSAILKNLPVVMISGLAGEGARILNANVKNLEASFLAKPFTHENFCQIISEIQRP